MDPLLRVRAILLLRRSEELEAQRTLGEARRLLERSAGEHAAAMAARQGMRAMEARARSGMESARGVGDGGEGEGEGMKAGTLARRAEVAEHVGAARRAEDATAARATERLRTAALDADRAREGLARAVRARQSAEKEFARRTRAAARDRSRRDARVVEDRGVPPERGMLGALPSEGAPHAPPWSAPRGPVG